MKGRRGLQFCRVVENRWPLLGIALGVIIAQWEVLSAYFHSDSVLLNANVFAVRQLRDR